MAQGLLIRIERKSIGSTSSSNGVIHDSTNHVVIPQQVESPLEVGIPNITEADTLVLLQAISTLADGTMSGATKTAIAGDL
jgi:hypothetical protein